MRTTFHDLLLLTLIKILLKGQLRGGDFPLCLVL